MFDLTLVGGTLVSSRGRLRADLGVETGRITSIAMDLSSAKSRRQIDLADMFVLPGCIDSHMHLWEAGFVADPDFSSGTLTAMAGGITTIIDQPLTPPEVLDASVFQAKLATGERSSYIDFGLHAGVGHDNLPELEGMWQAGCTAFKIFMSDSGCKVAALSDGEMLAAFREIGRLGGTVLIHAENEAMLQFNRARLQAEGRKDAQAFLDWRPPEVEYEAISRALRLLEGTKARAVFLHTTLPEGVELVQRARCQGLDVYVETCPHNIFLTSADLAEQGPWVTFAPPVRDPGRADRLLDLLAKGNIHTMGSDHGAVEPHLKEIGRQDIWQSLISVPDAETYVCLMLDAVSRGRLSLERLAAVQAENPARLYGLYPRKGSLQPGADADFTVVDLRPTYRLRASEMHTACGWIPYEGREITGRVTHTIVRGTVLMENGIILGKLGFGRFLPRGPQFSF